LAAAAVLLFVEMWSVVPAPTLPLLALAVVVPELAPWALAACAAIAALAWAIARGRLRAAALTLCALAAACSLVPLLQVRATIAVAERAMDRVARRSARGPSSRAFDPVTSFTGYRIAAGIRVRRDIPIALRDGTPSAIDLYRPAASGTHPTLVVIYGGAWRFGSRADTSEIDRAFAGRGYTVIAIDYRHAPAHRFPSQLEDVRDALAAIARQARGWDVDPQRVALLGRSAGAELALLAAYTSPALRVRAAVGYYTPANLVRGYREPPRPDPSDVRAILRAYLGGTPEERMSAYVAASPLSLVRRGLPPTLLIAGGRDELVSLDFQHELRDALVANGVPVVALELPWSNHAFDAVANGVGGQLARHYTQLFLTAFL